MMSFQLAGSDSPYISLQLWQWFQFSNQSEIGIAFYFDALTAVMTLVVTGIGFLIHLFAGFYMRNDTNFTRFMAYMNLFIVAMLLLVLADNLVLLYLGWEGVGLCSFLLIGFWYQDRENVLAARKAFIVTRVGDTLMAIGLFMLFDNLELLNIQGLLQAAEQQWQVGVDTAFWISLLLLGGAVGKSAQLPLQTWLPDAMAGPTPVSALIHAATMVTAGVYLIARMQGVFVLAPEVMTLVALVGAITLLMAAVSALVQTDIKRVLAYSTMSQIGYMMLALGAGAWSAGVFHLMTHAFFKALLFLTAGMVILAVHHQQNIFNMGGLLKKLPVESALFLIGLVCLVALPGTSGFFSKEAIIGQLWSSSTAGPLFWWLAIIGALLTSIYSCRLFFLVFLGSPRYKKPLEIIPAIGMKLPLMILAVLSLLGGLIELPLAAVFDPEVVTSSGIEPGWLHTVAIATPFIGIAISWLIFKAYRQSEQQSLQYKQSPIKEVIRDGLGFDWLYQKLLVNPFVWLAKANQKDIIDQVLMLSAGYTKLWHDVLSWMQTGSLRWYAASIGLGVVLLSGVILL